MAELELRSVPPSDALAFARTAEMTFANIATDEETKETKAEIYDPDWAIGVYDGSGLVATTSATSMELTLPAGAGQPFPVLEVIGVTGVGVLPTHRRRGLLNRMMAHQLGQLRERGVPLAILTASEAGIYGRYGYGLACSFQELTIATKRSQFLDGVGLPLTQGGRLRLLSAADAADVVPGVHQQVRRRRPGEIDRSKTRWELLLRDPERHRGGGGPRFYVLYEGPHGVPDGYASYRYKWNWEGGLPHHSVSVGDLYMTSTEVGTALWRYLLDLDLVGEVTARRPLDDPLRWCLADPRQLRTTRVSDMMWVRLVDIPVALAARGYGAETDLVLEVEGDPTGRYALATSPEAGDCRRARSRDKTDLSLGVAELGAIYLGGCRPSVLAAAGRIRELRHGALARADAAFASPLVPFCGTSF